MNAWLGQVIGEIPSNGMTVEDLQESLSWRVTEPLRALRLRERAARLRSGRPAETQPTVTPETSQALERARRALHGRLREVAPSLLDTNPGSTDLESLLGLLCSSIRRSGSDAELWLLMVAVSGCFPDQGQLIGLARDLRGASDAEAVTRILQHCGVWTTRHHSQLRTMRVVSDRPVVYVDLAARFDSNLGIQQVTRETINRWKGDRPVVLAALTKDGTALRGLTQEEDERVRSGPSTVRVTSLSRGSTDEQLVVPWQTSLFVPEIPNSLGSVTVGALARYSDNRTVALGYDTVPASSGQHVTGDERLVFNHYLTMLKYFDVIVTVSDASFEEFSGFCEALRAQGLTGPVVRQVSLPIDRSDAGKDGLAPLEEIPVKILSVGSNVPRKNHLAIAYAAELLWREGLEFELTLIGGEGDMHYTAVTDAVSALVAQGRSIVLRRNVTEAELAEAYGSAHFTVFLSLHDSGLPVAESLAAGTPVLTSNYGGPLSIAAAGGCLLVDPRDDDSIVASMRALLGEPQMIERLRQEIVGRNDPGWDDYADMIDTTLRNEEKGQ